eukprot:8305074-Alexandrium_andersonii.AAC.1
MALPLGAPQRTRRRAQPQRRARARRQQGDGCNPETSLLQAKGARRAGRRSARRGRESSLVACGR